MWRTTRCAKPQGTGSLVRLPRRQETTALLPGMNLREVSGGANLRNVWKIATHSFPGAHFATFPPKLVEPCIKAGTSEHGACPECGAPWERVIEKFRTLDGERNDGLGAMFPKDTTKDIGRVPCSAQGVGHWRIKTEAEEKGWAPTCDHDADPVPCTLLDPFGGAGTVGLVADRLGRDAILIDISPEYAEMGRRRIEDDAPLFADVEASE